MRLEDLNPFHAVSSAPDGGSITGTGAKESGLMAKEPKNSEVVDTKKSQDFGDVGADTTNREGEGGLTTNQVDLEATRGVVDERLEKLNARNAEGHEKNMKAIEDAVKKEDAGKPDPKLGREDNGNTPRVLKDGSKVWGPPGVAGAVR